MELAQLYLKGMSSSEVSKRFNFSPKQLEQISEQELRAEIDYLLAENAVLKKLEALAQQKCLSAKKKCLLRVS